MDDNVQLRHRQRCEKCKHWTRQDMAYEAGDCGSGKFIYIINETPRPRDGLFYLDADGYNAWVITGPDFGCIHFEERT